MNPAAPLFSLACADVLKKFEGKKAAGALDAAVITALIPTAVQGAIDIAIQAGGPAVQALVVAAKPAIRTYVSNTAILFLEKALANLADATTPPAA